MLLGLSLIILSIPFIFLCQTLFLVTDVFLTYFHCFGVAQSPVCFEKECVGIFFFNTCLKSILIVWLSISRFEIIVSIILRTLLNFLVIYTVSKKSDVILFLDSL